MPALLIPVARPDSGTDGEVLVCDCGHRFTRDRLDRRIEVYDTNKFDWFDPNEMTGREVLDALKDCVRERNECPVCSCCVLEDDEISVGDADEDEEQQWLCTGCGRIYDEEDDAAGCCA